MTTTIISLVLNLVLILTLATAAYFHYRYQPRHDRLTGVYNRYTFEKLLARLAVQDDWPVSIIICDINSLRLINEKYSQYAGDAVISTVAAIIKQNCRRGDLIGRTSGGEFTVYMPGAGVAAAQDMIRRILSDCRTAGMQAGGQAIGISLALGAATRVAPGQNLTDLQREAAENMQKRKLLESHGVHNAISTSLRSALHKKSLETEAHFERMAKLTRYIGSHMNLSASELDHLELLAVMHDLGKVGIPDSILNKVGPLNDAEWVIMKRHPELGCRIASAFPELDPIADDILSHHERWDGTGYPRGLASAEIPLLARILAVVDAFDAMTSERPYRATLSSDQALAEIRRCAGTQFDPAVVDAFIQLTYIFGQASPSENRRPGRLKRQLLTR